MANDDDKSRDNWHRITLRLPPSLHQRLIDGAGNLSLNASIVQRLEDSFADQAEKLRSYEDVKRAVSQEVREEMNKALKEALGEMAGSRAGHNRE